MTTWIHRVDEPGPGPRLAVKDNIAVGGLPTSAGCRGYARRYPEPAARDAAVIGAMRSAGARLTGTVTLHELATGRTGINRWYGTPRNPLDPRLVPGGSSSGSAVAVAAGEADIGVGTDTGGSIRVPAACCGIAGLKTTYGRLPRDGVVPAAPSLDTVGFLTRDVAGLVTAMRLVEPGFEIGPDDPPVIGRLRGHGETGLETAVDRALAAAGWLVRDVQLRPFAAAEDANYAINTAEVAELFGWLLDDPEQVGEDVADRLRDGLKADVATARIVAGAWRGHLARVFHAVDLIALPTLASPPPPLDEVTPASLRALTRPVNLAGVPALAVPLPGGPGHSLQLIGPAGSEDRLLAAGLAIERALD